MKRTMTKKTKRMPIEDMPQEFLDEEREPVDFDSLIETAIHPEGKGMCDGCPKYSRCFYPDGRSRLFDENNLKA